MYANISSAHHTHIVLSFFFGYDLLYLYFVFAVSYASCRFLCSTIRAWAWAWCCFFMCDLSAKRRMPLRVSQYRVFGEHTILLHIYLRAVNKWVEIHMLVWRCSLGNVFCWPRFSHSTTWIYCHIISSPGIHFTFSLANASHPPKIRECGIYSSILSSSVPANRIASSTLVCRQLHTWAAMPCRCATIAGFIYFVAFEDGGAALDWSCSVAKQAEQIICRIIFRSS